MRRLKSLSLAVAGFALVASVAEAGLPTVGSNSGGQPQAPKRGLRAGMRKTANLCPDCAARLASQGPIPASAPCTSCGEVHGAPGAAASYAMTPGSTPGYTIIGDGSPSPMNMAAGGVPGHAIVGGAMPSSDPTPIDVMQTNYHQTAPGTLGASVAMNGGAAPYGANIPYAKASEMPGGLYSPANTRHRSYLGRLLLPDFGRRRRAEAEARQRESHARISYGAANAATDLPASMVYGSGGH